MKVILKTILAILGFVVYLVTFKILATKIYTEPQQAFELGMTCIALPTMVGLIIYIYKKKIIPKGIIMITLIYGLLVNTALYIMENILNLRPIVYSIILLIVSIVFPYMAWQLSKHSKKDPFSIRELEERDNFIQSMQGKRRTHNKTA